MVSAPPFPIPFRWAKSNPVPTAINYLARVTQLSPPQSQTLEVTARQQLMVMLERKLLGITNVLPLAVWI